MALDNMAATQAEIEDAERWDSEHPPFTFCFGLRAEDWWSRVKRRIYAVRMGHADAT